jgi:hypothetical protein
MRLVQLPLRHAARAMYLFTIVVDYMYVVRQQGITNLCCPKSKKQTSFFICDPCHTRKKDDLLFLCRRKKGGKVMVF